MEYLENEYLKIVVAEHGAELSGMINKRTGKEMIWQADPKFWARHAPVLFPFVGNVNEGVYRYKGASYPMTAHGFARDMDFDFREKTDNSISFSLKSSPKTKENYPFDFELVITHTLDKNKVRVQWEVINPSESEPLYYSIGGHPAFTCPLNEGESRNGYKVKFNRNELSYVLILQDTREVDFENPSKLTLEDGYLTITEHLFDKDALIFDDCQVESASLCTPDGEPYITLNCKGFTSFGLWSNPSSEACYVCLEPWLGRCDNKGFKGDLPNKYGVQMLSPAFSQIHEYEIIVH